MAQGFLQVPVVDFDETFAPVTYYQFLRILLALANCYGWHVHQMDVKSTFLNGNLKKEIFMNVPPGYEAKENEVWLLHKALYSLKQVLREWYLKLKKELESLVFVRSSADHGVFIKTIEGRLFVIAVWVDDFLLFSSNIGDMEEIKWSLA